MSQRLAGPWKLAVDPGDSGRSAGWTSAAARDALDAIVPGTIQQIVPDYHGVAWYWTTFAISTLAPDRHVLIDFGAVDYKATVWVNGHEIGSHRGSDSPFTFDITDSVITGGENVLAIRVLNPTDEPIDGLTLAQTPHGNKTIKGFRPGNAYDFGGILLPVDVRIVPPVRIQDVAVRPMPDSGAVHVVVTFDNDLADAFDARLDARILSGQHDTGHDAAMIDVTLPSGSSDRTIELSVADPHLWDIVDPFLYRLALRLDWDPRTVGAGDAGAVDAVDARAVRFGFRDFRLVDGFFHLNGRRIFVKSTHTGNHYPAGWVVPTDPDFYRRDLVNAKAIGYNMVRFISGLAWPEQLDLCDELGLLVYEESAAAWLLAPSPDMPDLFDGEIRSMVMRDRNHASVVIWGMLNETYDGPVFRHAVEALAVVRDLDEGRLVLLSSGRWDGQPSIGSASNPDTRTWEHVWGRDAADAQNLEITPSNWVGSRGPRDFGRMAYLPTAGDVHLYPFVPHDDETENLIRTMGAGTKPVYLSELGIGSVFDAIREWRGFQQAGVPPEVPDGAYIRSMAMGFEADWHRLGFDDVFPFPEDFLRLSAEHMARQRATCFDLIRSNPQIAGYNLTGMLDHGLTGEGIWSFWRKWKPGIVDVVASGWDPLRWCLFARPVHAYAGAPVRLEAVLANDGALAPGDHPARFRLFGPSGPVWEASRVVSVVPRRDGRPPLAQPVIDESVDLPAEEGEYTFAASLMSGGDARADRRSFRVSAPATALDPAVTVTTWGLADRVAAWLAGRGVFGHPLVHGGGMEQVIVIGDPAAAGDPADGWERVALAVRGGATAVVVGTDAFEPAEGGRSTLPMAPDLSVSWVHDWLYHKDCVAKADPLFDGLPSGLLDWDVYGQTIPNHVLTTDRPGDVVAASFTVGAPVPDGYRSGILAAGFREGAGRILVSTFRILGHVGAHPAADRLLLNLIQVGRASSGSHRVIGGKVVS